MPVWTLRYAPCSNSASHHPNGHGKQPPLMMKLAMPVSLMELLAIPLAYPKTVTKWLVISPTLSRERARGRTNRCASFTLT